MEEKEKDMVDGTEKDSNLLDEKDQNPTRVGGWVCCGAAWQGQGQ